MLYSARATTTIYRPRAYTVHALLGSEREKATAAGE